MAIAKQPAGAADGTPTLSIGELAERTGVPVATLRSWELRHGEPRSLPRSGGHRRYDEQAVATVRGIVARRSAGFTLEAAVEALREPDRPPRPERSVFAALREHHPELPVHQLSRASLLAVTVAAEDEYVARAERALLFAGFQTRDFFHESEARWSELGRIADAAVVFADFGLEPPSGEGGLVAVDITGESPLRREWFIVCDGDDFAICVIGRELLGNGSDTTERRFESLWSVSPEVVRTAARACTLLLERQHPRHPRLAAVQQRLGVPVRGASEDLRRVEALFIRVVSYMDNK